MRNNCQRLTEQGHEVVVHWAGVSPLPIDLTGCNLLVLGSPTYYGGELESKMENLLAQFQPDLTPFKVAVFSLGDQSYGNFCNAAALLESWVIAHQGTLVCPPLKIDGYPTQSDSINTWVGEVLKACQ
jgi:flavodoxin